MLISMKEAIARTIEWEDNKPQSSKMNTTKGYWNSLTVKDVLANPDVVECLLKSANGQLIEFSDTISEVALFHEIDKFVVMQVTGLINHDFLPPDTSGSIFSKDELAKLTDKNPNLLSSLEFAIDQLEDSPYKNVPVRDFLPALVALENLKKPDFDLQYSKNDEAFTIIGDWIASGKERGRLIHLTDADWHLHAQYLDYKLVDGRQPSVLWIDSWYVHDGYGSFLDFQTALRRKNNGACKEVDIAAIELKNQSVGHGCPIFALNTAKQIYKDRGDLDALHQQNVELPSSASRKIKSDAIIPAHMMKHTQSGERLKEYLRKNPEAATAPVNKKGATLQQYRDLHYLYAPFDKETHMRSIYIKRLDALVELRDALGMSPP